MVLGYGAHGGRGRCYDFWLDFVQCVTENGTRNRHLCELQREDYMECLHRTKQMRRIATVLSEKERLIKEGKWDS